MRSFILTMWTYNHGIAPSYLTEMLVYRNQLFQPSPVFPRRCEMIFLCREQKLKQSGGEVSPTSGPRPLEQSI